MIVTVRSMFLSNAGVHHVALRRFPMTSITSSSALVDIHPVCEMVRLRMKAGLFVRVRYFDKESNS